jgi:hypothetical protein
MFFRVRGWRCTNRAKYIGGEKVEGSIQGKESFFSDLLSGRKWVVRTWWPGWAVSRKETNISPDSRVIVAPRTIQSHLNMALNMALKYSFHSPGFPFMADFGAQYMQHPNRVLFPWISGLVGFVFWPCVYISICMEYSTWTDMCRLWNRSIITLQMFILHRSTRRVPLDLTYWRENYTSHYSSFHTGDKLIMRGTRRENWYFWLYLRVWVDA